MQASEVLTFIFGGGTIALLTFVWGAYKDWRNGKLTKEDTAIKRWKDLATEERDNADKVERKLIAYRRWYAPLWVAYHSLPDHRPNYFPADPGGDDKFEKEDK